MTSRSADDDTIRDLVRSAVDSDPVISVNLVESLADVERRAGKLDLFDDLQVAHGEPARDGDTSDIHSRLVMAGHGRRHPTPPGLDDDPEPERDQILYDQGGVRVTSTAVTAHGRCYPIAELRYIRTLRGPHSDLTINAGLAAGMVLIAIARLWDYLDTAAWLGAVAVAVLAVAVVLAIVGSRIRRRLHIMIAEYRTLTVLLVLEEDSERYALIHRAVLQAQASSDRHGPARADLQQPL
jgi:hypothetical protein